MGNNIEKNHIARVTYEKTLRASPNQKGGEAASLQAFPAWGRGTASAVDRVLSYAEQMRLSFPYTTSCLSYHSHPIRPFRAPSPRGEGCDTRIPSSKKGGEAATSTLNLEPNESKVKRDCEEMNPHFFIAPFLYVSHHLCSKISTRRAAA